MKQNVTKTKTRPRKTSIAQQEFTDKYEIAMKRGWLCECGCGQPAQDLHHCFIHNIKQRGRSKYPELNDPRNLVFVNHDQHIARKFDTLEWRRYFWEIQVDRYGYPAMMEWVHSLPMKLLSRINEITGQRENALPFARERISNVHKRTTNSSE